MEASKVVLANGEVLIDLTEDTVAPETLAEGVTAHGADGKPIVGTMRTGTTEVWTLTLEDGTEITKEVVIA